MDNLFNLDSFKKIEDIVRGRLGEKFVIAYMDEEGCHTYISAAITDMEACYIADTINSRREEQ